MRQALISCPSAAGGKRGLYVQACASLTATQLDQSKKNAWLAASYLGMTTATVEKHYGQHRLDYQNTAVTAVGGKRK